MEINKAITHLVLREEMIVFISQIISFAVYAPRYTAERHKSSLYIVYFSP